MATNISNLGKGIVFENVLNQNGVFDKIKIPEKKEKLIPNHFSLFGIEPQ